MSSWSYITNHTHVILGILRDPHMTVREIASMVQLTERSVLKIINDLVMAGVIIKMREGRQNVYQVNLEAPLQKPLAQPATLGDLVHGLALPEPVED